VKIHRNAGPPPKRTDLRKRDRVERLSDTARQVLEILKTVAVGDMIEIEGTVPQLSRIVGAMEARVAEEQSRGPRTIRCVANGTTVQVYIIQEGGPIMAKKAAKPVKKPVKKPAKGC
jgi:hypothetical protein